MFPGFVLSFLFSPLPSVVSSVVVGLVGVARGGEACFDVIPDGLGRRFGLLESEDFTGGCGLGGGTRPEDDPVPSPLSWEPGFLLGPASNCDIMAETEVLFDKKFPAFTGRAMPREVGVASTLGGVASLLASSVREVSRLTALRESLGEGRGIPEGEGSGGGLPCLLIPFSPSLMSEVSLEKGAVDKSLSNFLLPPAPPTPF